MPAPRSTAVAFAAVLLGGGAARAQSQGGMALNQFDAAPAGDTFFSVPSASAVGKLTPRAAVVVDYADQPLVLEQEGARESVVRGQGFLHLSAALAIQDRLLVSLLLPIAFLQRAGDTARDVESAEVGDLRLGARVRMVGADGGPAQAAVGAYLYLPTGQEGSFAGEGATRVTPHGALSGRIPLRALPLNYAVFFGGSIRGSDNPSSLVYGAGVSASLSAWGSDRIRVGPEVFASTPIQERAFSLAGGENGTVARSESTSAELLLGVRARIIGGLVVGWAAGPGLTEGVGTPGFRIAGTIAWALGATSANGAGDTDADGIPDARDACPDAAGTSDRRAGCPVLDDDEDGVDNGVDACPAEPGAKSIDAKRSGCPAPPPTDTDGDAVPNAADACPDRAGVASDDPKRAGCPEAP